MKRVLFLILLAIGIDAKCQIQLRLSGEYGAGLQKDFIKNVDLNGKQSIQRGSYGSGLLINFSFGKSFQNNVSLMCDLSYLSSINYQQNTISQDGRIEYITISQGNYFSVTPNLIIKAQGEGVKPYVRFGPMIAFAKVTEDRSFTDQPAGRDIFVLSGGVSVGGMAALGVEIFAGDGAVIFAELVSRNLYYHPEKLRNVETFPGEQPDNDKFYKNDPKETDEILAVSKNFSSLGASVGIKLNINLKKPVVNY